MFWRLLIITAILFAASCQPAATPDLPPASQSIARTGDFAMQRPAKGILDAGVSLSDQTSQIRYFETAGNLRRAVEARIVHAILLHERDPDAAYRQWEEAARLISLSYMPYHGAPSDRFAGDLPLLLAMAQAQGLPATVLEHGPTQPVTLLQIASDAYEAQADDAFLTAARLLLFDAYLTGGDVRQAARMLTKVIIAGESGLDRGLINGPMRVFAEYLRDPWLMASLDKVAGVQALELGETHIGFVPSRIPTMMMTPAGRQKLAAAIESARLGLRSTLEIDQSLVAALRGHVREPLTSGEWRFGKEAGLLLAERGDEAAARTYLENAVAATEKVRESIDDHRARQAFFADTRSTYLALVDRYVGINTESRGRENFARALWTANGVKARGLLDILEGREPPARNFREPAHDEEELREVFLKRFASDTIEPIRSFRPEDRFAALRGIEVLQERLPADAALLEYALGQAHGYVWVIEKDRISLRKIRGLRYVQEYIEEMESWTLRSNLNPAEFSRFQEVSRRLFVELIGPVSDLIVEKSTLVIAPDDGLYELPFEALLRPLGEGDEYLIESHAIQYIPSSAVWLALLERDRPEPQGLMIAVGEPDLSGSDQILATLVSEPSRGGLRAWFSPLPDAERELVLISRLYGNAGRLRVGTHARLDSPDLASARYIHIATHGLSDAPTSLDLYHASEPALLVGMGQGALTTLTDILHLQWSAELITLSGCSTGRGSRDLGDGAFGLAGAFLVAGATSVVATKAPVADADAARLMVEFHTGLRRGEHPAAALRNAQLSAVRRGLAPFRWASFRMVGGKI